MGVGRLRVLPSPCGREQDQREGKDQVRGTLLSPAQVSAFLGGGQGALPWRRRWSAGVGVKGCARAGTLQVRTCTHGAGGQIFEVGADSGSPAERRAPHGAGNRWPYSSPAAPHMGPGPPAHLHLLSSHLQTCWLLAQATAPPSCPAWGPGEWGCLGAWLWPACQPRPGPPSSDGVSASASGLRAV